MCLFWAFLQKRPVILRSLLIVATPYREVLKRALQGGEDSKDAWSFRSFFRKRATIYRALLRKMTYEDKASYGSTPPCMYILKGLFHFSKKPCTCVGVLQIDTGNLSKESYIYSQKRVTYVLKRAKHILKTKQPHSQRSPAYSQRALYTGSWSVYIYILVWEYPDINPPTHVQGYIYIYISIYIYLYT